MLTGKETIFVIAFSETWTFDNPDNFIPSGGRINFSWRMGGGRDSVDFLGRDFRDFPSQETQSTSSKEIETKA